MELSFTKAHRRDLLALGLAPPNRSKSCATHCPISGARWCLLLRAVADHTGELNALLCAIEAQGDPAHAAAHADIEEGYWRRRPADDVGGMVAHVLCEPLATLRDTALAVQATMPKEQARPRASTLPVVAIERALLTSWLRTHNDINGLRLMFRACFHRSTP